ncbi:hypothetical protein T484DRAFT_1909820 [Baffinella frigidus]|nr:hypothetical protein T484DRAFT_1909820 [Cryptophyta sp. CCMP2293]
MNARVSRRNRCGWPLSVAAEVLAVAQGLARARLQAAAAPPPDQGGAVERECGHSLLCGGCVGDFLARQGEPRCPHCGAKVVREQIEQGTTVSPPLG